MKKHGIYRWLLWVAVCFLLAGCQQLEEDAWDAGSVGTLSVETRSVADEEIPYPLFLYAFSDSGDCVSLQTIESEGEKIQLKLPSGRYRIVAVAGCSDGYVVPEVEHWDDRIELDDEEAPENPLMMGMAEVEVDSKAKDKLEIALSYPVTAIEVTLNAIPGDVEEVSVTMSSFYASMTLKGGYEAPDYMLELKGSQDDSGCWHAERRYVFPGGDEEMLLSIVFKLKDGTKTTCGYVWKDTPEAGQPYHLKGDYAGNLMLNGCLVMPTWGETIDVDFEFGHDNHPDDDEEEEPELDLSALPEAGSVWNGCLVVGVGEADASGAEILLMSLEEWDVLTSQVDELIAGYSVNGISGWRLPDYEEAQFLKRSYSDDNREALNECIWAYDDSLVGLDREGRYLCLKSDVYYSFAFAGGTNISKAGEKKSYYVRLVKSYKVNL